MTTDWDSPDIWDDYTRQSRADLTRALIAEHPTVRDARVTCNQAPLQVEGELADGRILMFHLRHGTATLEIAWPFQRPTRVTVPCPETISVDDVGDATALFATLLHAHPEHP
jgi:hypothetical protein